MHVEKGSIFSDVVKYIQYNQHPIRHYELEVEEPVERHGTRYIKCYEIVNERLMK